MNKTFTISIRQVKWDILCNLNVFYQLVRHRRIYAMAEPG